MLVCVICGTAHLACGGPSTSTPIDQEISDMVVSMPRKGLVRTEAPDMVRVQLKPNDIRSYRRRDAEEILAQAPEAFIIGEQPGDDAAEERPKAQRSAPNKARGPKAQPSQTSTAPAETKSEPPSAPPSDGQPPADPPKAD